MVVGIYANPRRDGDGAIRRQAAKELGGAGLSTRFIETREQLLSLTPQILVVLGGDGTMLRIAADCADAGTAIAGVNLGSVGFLSEAERGEIGELAARLGSGNYRVEERVLLEVRYEGGAYPALNEAVLLRDGCDAAGCVVTIDAYVGETLLDRYVGDGAIVCTPTGSTAYALSAGGAVLSPNVAAFQVLPICSHSLHTRPVVVADCETVRLAVRSGVSARLEVDGRPLGRAEEITVSRYAKPARFVKFKDTSFYARLLAKLNAWSAVKPW